MKKDRPFLLLSLLIIVGLMLVACGAQAETPAEEPAESVESVEEPEEAAEEPIESVEEPEESAEEPAESQEAEEPMVETTLIVGAVDDNYYRDPNPDEVGQANVGQGAVNTNIFETLTFMDHNFQLQPGLATSWEYDAERGVWVFQLREGVTFHDGQPFTAEAVVYTLSGRAGGEWAGLIGGGFDENSTVAVDDYTVEIATTNVQAAGQLAHPLWGIRAPDSDPYAGEHTGTGPFKFEEYVPSDFISVTKFEDYWGEPAQVDRIEFRFMPDPNARVLALQAGDVDLIYDIPRESAGTLESVSGILLQPTTVSAYQALSVLVSGEDPYTITQDPLVREAIGYALDRQEIVDVAFQGFAENVQTWMPPGILGDYADLVEAYSYDPDRAMSLLDEAGWVDGDGDGIREKDGQTLTLKMVSGFPTCADNGQSPEVVQAQLRRVGIETTLTCVPDYPAYDELLIAKEGDLWVEIGNQNSASPCFLPLFLFYGREEAPNEWQAAFGPALVGFEEVSDELDNCTAASETEEAARWAAEAVHTIVDEARTEIPMVGIYRIWGTRDCVTGFQPHPVFVFIEWGQVSTEGCS
jgi:peptide/nickel transport system substrate-binding protein